MGLRIKILILWRFTENSDFYGGESGGWWGGRFAKNQCIGGNFQKRGLKQFADLRGGGLAKKKGLVFLRGG